MGTPLFPDVVVNGEPVSHAAIATEAQNHNAPKSKPGLAWRKAANAVALRTLLLQEARNRRLGAAPRTLGPGRTETEDDALIRALLDACITHDLPTCEEVHAEWSRDPARFRAPSLWEASHILIACNPNNPDDKTTAHRRATMIANTLKHAPDQFLRHVTNSDCASKNSGGSLAQISPGDTVPAFEAALRNLREGEITERPVLTRFGWHIIRMDAYLPGDVLPFETVRNKIAVAMEKAHWAAAAKDFAAELIAYADIQGADL